MKQFKAPKQSLRGLDAEAAATLVATAADVALILDGAGVIRDLAFDSEELSLEAHETWLGRAWVDTVTVESRPKVEALLHDAATKAPSRWRHVNHPSPAGADIPVSTRPFRSGPTAGSSRSAGICARSRSCSSGWWTRSSRWSATTHASAAQRPATVCCSSPPRSRC